MCYIRCTHIGNHTGINPAQSFFIDKYYHLEFRCLLHIPDLPENRLQITAAHRTALDAMKEKQAAGANVSEILNAGVAAAGEGVEATKPLVATKGRASYLGERSIGHQDPGATSFTLMLREIAKAY